jgi:hypothetical protein
VSTIDDSPDPAFLQVAFDSRTHWINVAWVTRFRENSLSSMGAILGEHAQQCLSLLCAVRRPSRMHLLTAAGYRRLIGDDPA